MIISCAQPLLRKIECEKGAEHETRRILGHNDIAPTNGRRTLYLLSIEYIELRVYYSTSRYGCSVYM